MKILIQICDVINFNVEIQNESAAMLVLPVPRTICEIEVELMEEGVVMMRLMTV